MKVRIVGTITETFELDVDISETTNELEQYRRAILAVENNFTHAQLKRMCRGTDEHRIVDVRRH